MSKLRRYVDQADKPIGWVHWCPGCRQIHVFNVEQANKGGARWTFNGNQDKPTFRKSMLVYSGGFKKADGKMVPERTLCHYHLVDGMIRFLPDSAHELKGKTVPLPEIPEAVMPALGK